MVAVASVAAGIAIVTSSWRQAMLAEAYLPDLQVEAAKSPGNVDALALLGAKMALADSPNLQRASLDVLKEAADAGDSDPELWQTVAWIHARQGDTPGAVKSLEYGKSVVASGSEMLDSSLSRLNELSPNAPPGATAIAISPTGAVPLQDLYLSGSFLSPIIEFWQRRSPDTSGFITRKHWAQRDPGDVQACQLWGAALMRDDRVNEGFSTLENCVAIAPNSADAHDSLGQAIEDAGRPEDAEVEYIRALDIDPNRVSTLIEFGRAAVGDHAAYARAALIKATAIAPNAAEAWLALGDNGFNSTANYVSALRAYQNAGRIDPTALSLNDNYATSLVNNDDMSDAEPLLRRILLARPADTAAHAELALLLLETPTAGRLTEAETDARTALAHENSADLHLLLGKILLAEGKPRDAVRELNASVALSPNLMPALRLVASACAQTGDMAGAAAAVRRAASVQTKLDQIDDLNRNFAAHAFSASFHQQLCDLYTETGNQTAAYAQQQIAAAIRRDPKGFKYNYDTSEAMMRKAIGTSVVSED